MRQRIRSTALSGFHYLITTGESADAGWLVSLTVTSAAIGDLDKRNATVHPKLFPVKSHGAVVGAGTGAHTVHFKSELFLLRDSANFDSPSTSNVSGPGSA